jgi:hypothetical protein
VPARNLRRHPLRVATSLSSACDANSNSETCESDVYHTVLTPNHLLRLLAISCRLAARAVAALFAYDYKP